MSSAPEVGKHRHPQEEDTAAPLSAADAALGLLSLSQMPQRREPEYRALFGLETPASDRIIIDSAIKIIAQLIATAAAARREPVDAFVARYRKAMMHARDNEDTGP